MTMSTGAVTTEPVGGDKMNALCQELLLPGSTDAGNENNHGISSENLVVGQSLLLTEASVVGTETAGVEIFVEAVTSSMSLSNPGSTTEVLVKVVELYFCERCGQSFSDPGLLSQHQCIELPRGQLASIPQLQELPLGLTSQSLAVSGEQSAVHEAQAQGLLDTSRQDPEFCTDPLLCPVCQVEFALPTELKEHFRDHQKPTGPQVCFEEGCHFSSEDRKQLRGHLRHVHQVCPVTCTYRGCSLLFRSREDMDLHRRSHFPFHCRHCDFISGNTKQFGQHRHSHLQEPTQQDVEAALETGAVAESTEHSFTAIVGKRLAHHLLLTSGREEPLSKAENCLEVRSGWDVTEMEPGLGAHVGSSHVPPEDSGPKEDTGDEFQEEEEVVVVVVKESFEKKASSKRTKAQLIKEGAVEDSKYLFKTHMCPECKRCFKKRTHLVEHLHLHFPDPRLQCPNCQKFFTSKSKLKIHMMRENGEKAHRCPLCHYSSVEKNALNRHMASMHEDISNFYSDVYSCPVCKETFKLSHALKEHLKTHKAEPKQLSCFQADCSYCTEDRKDFLRHVREAHYIKAVECKYYACSLLFPTAEVMEAHRKTHYAFHCQQCDFICSNKHVFRKHKKQGHPGSEQLQCSFCPFATFNSVEFHDHVGKMHASEKIHKCTECNFATAHKRVLIRHMLLHTGEKPHKCQLCDFTCRDVSYLSKHMLTHSDDKNYMCTECGYVTKWKHYLNVHMRKHTGDLRYQCNQCSYRCHRADQLSSHKLRHQGKSLICEVCGFACKRKYELQKHMQAKHSQNYQSPVFQCQYCSYQTKYKQALLNHENCKHTKQREFRCALCPYRTFSNTSLFFHKRKVHGYVPGDKGWQENYASKELEVTSTEVLLSYNLAMTLHAEPSPSLSRRHDKTKALVSEVQEEDGPQETFIMSLFGSEGNAETGREEVVGEQDHSKTDAAPSEELSTKAFPKGSGESDSIGKPLPTCTLHLETLCSSDPEQLVEEMPAAMPDSGAAQNCKEVESAYEALGSKDSLLLEDSESALDDIPDFEEEAEVHEDREMELEKGAGSRTVEENKKDAQQDLGDSKGDGRDSELEQGLGCKEPSIQEAWPKGSKQDSLQPVTGHETLLAPEDMLPPSEEGSDSESVLKALRRQDKEQAETLVLEGRVQMLVVQSESRVFKCEKCSYITRKEKSMLVHCKAGCQGRKCPLVCQECGATFKQQRGLNTHLLKKCPALVKKTGGKAACLDQPAAVQPNGKSLEIAEAKKNGTGTPDEEVSELQKASWDAEPRPVNAESTAAVLPNTQSLAISLQEKPSQDVPETMVEEQLPGATADTASNPLEKYYVEQSKFHCKACSFACSRVSTIRSHVEDGCRGSEQFCCPLCSKPFRSKRAVKIHQLEGHVEAHPTQLLERTKRTADSEGGDQQANGQIICKEMGRANEPAGASCPRPVATHKKRHFSCPSCPFTCHQERALKTHKKRGCLKLGEFRCTLCPFTSKAAAALRLHRKLHRKYYSSRPQLACRQCDFTCKQVRCLRQHVRIKHEGVKPHKCPYCEFSTTRRYRLDAHQSLHTGVGRIACPTCGQTFGTNSKLRIHRLRVHEKKPTHFCPLCDYSGYIQNDITRHVNSCHQGELNFACAHCQARFSSETALKQHALRQHEEKVSYACPRCAFVCHSEATLKCHVQKQHPHLECTTCKATLATREELEEHKKLHFSHRCDICSYAAKERQQLVSHYLEAHEPPAASERPLRCSFCDFGCCHQLVLDHHVKGHGGTRIYKCSDCEYATKNKQKITWHIRIHTGEKPYKCHLCQYACADPSRLKYHMRIHKEERKYLCPECGYKCKWVNQLKYHMTKHTGIKPYQCDECEYCTNRADALRIHKETRHREARSFICEQCGKAFKTRFLLKTHLKKHSEEKPYVCNVCYRGFRWAAGLRHHYLTHTNEHPFFCRYCSYKAKQKFQVIKHLQRHHPEQGGTEGDLSKGVGKDPSTLPVHLHDAQLEIPPSKHPEVIEAQVSPHG
ncbi:zinc finger protein 142 [Podarcis raffonei]|uniref:zinc finger protein 142 n=1 Tax=Podarcis raffonei TaxID=65483 RepID=UPI0023290756|nr:zinc finger protein 142 [Podarcis raffonei]XP_053257982.1 zinc finger protein 142 [Podarcis raffonei]XP_053257983.1 zinc finger protein 142 [Podarcis raffonei]